jgi:hypothetical protein
MVPEACRRAPTPGWYAMIRASAPETLRVRLLSSAHARQADATNKEPKIEVGAAACDRQANRVPPATMARSPAMTRGLVASRKAIQARSAVNTVSRFNRSEAVAASRRRRPVINSTGAITPPTTVAATSHAQSERTSPIGDLPRYWASQTRLTPTPLPTYRRPATMTGLAPARSSLAIGVVAPKSTADAKAAASARVDPPLFTRLRTECRRRSLLCRRPPAPETDRNRPGVGRSRRRGPYRRRHRPRRHRHRHQRAHPASACCRR